MCSTFEDEGYIKYRTNIKLEMPIWMELKLNKQVAFNRHFSEAA